MNKVAIKDFAVEARKKLLASVKDKAGCIGITKEKITDAISQGKDYAVFPTHIGIETTLTGKELKQRENLVERLKDKDFDIVMEEVAYTWFNRIIAIRFMEVNDYLPSRIRVLSSETEGKFEPDIVTQAPNIDLALTPQEREKVITLKERNELDQLFRMLFIKQCNELGEILPELFKNTAKCNQDYTEILLDISYTNENGVIRDLLKIDEEDFLDEVEIIGWMYQYYNTELKEKVFTLLKKNIKIAKEHIPAATQLFTPDWIVRYMVENSLGRLWLEGHPNDKLKEGWKYYLDEAEQEPAVVAQLEKIRANYKNINPEEIKVIDPCMGSGHILVYAFEVLMQIYESCGYTVRDAARLIVEKNLYGLDIDDRAYQLAYFAVMMKGRKYDRRFLTKGITPNLCSIQESNGLISFEQRAGQVRFDSLHRETANYLIEVFHDAKEYGSILNIEPRDYDGLLSYIRNLQQKGSNDLFLSTWLKNVSAIMPALIRQAKIMAQKYDVVITNPPYMGSRSMNKKLSDFVKKKYPDSKSDLFAVFIEKGFKMAKDNGYICMVTMQSWMFLSSFEKMREKILATKTISNLMHMENMVMGIAFGTAVSVFKNSNIQGYKGTYNQIKLKDIDDKNQPKEFPVRNNRFAQVCEKNFSKIPGMPIAYWVSDKVLESFCNKTLDDYVNAVKGLDTCDNKRFVRDWYEVDISKIGFKIEDTNNTFIFKWYPYCKGGGYKKWYGFNEKIVNWENDGEILRNLRDDRGKIKSRPQNTRYYFKKGLIWSTITSYKLSMRIMQNSIFGGGGSGLFTNNNLNYIFAFINSNVSHFYLNLLNPTLNFLVGDILSLPLLENNKYKSLIDELVTQNISISKTDWDSFETSWDFKRHPLLQYRMQNVELGTKSELIADCFQRWEEFTDKQFAQLKANEEELNRIFIEIYGLQDELTPKVEDKDVTIRRADLQRDIRSFVSYAVGCMFGRYSLDVEGLIYAGGEWDERKYKTFIPNQDNILPITDEEYFDDDIVACFIGFVKVVYGEDTLEDNLDFIAQALGNRGNTSREVIRNYFLRDFYKDHVKIYKKRPIYWLFNSGKENGFKALIYLHRYNEDTVGRVRVDYLHRTQKAIENALNHCDVVLESSTLARDKANAVKRKGKLVKQLAETRIYDQAIAHIAHQRIPLDLDDGVKVNYAKFQGVEVAREGKKAIKVDLLAKI